MVGMGMKCFFGEWWIEGNGGFKVMWLFGLISLWVRIK